MVIPKLRQAIALAVRKIDVTETDAWKDLSLLAKKVTVDALELFEEEIQLKNSDFSGALVWYVTLEYGPDEDPISTTESFPGKFEGHLDNEQPHIDSMVADTSSLSEPDIIGT
jgi:hypothetical protein